MGVYVKHYNSGSTGSGEYWYYYLTQDELDTFTTLWPEFVTDDFVLKSSINPNNGLWYAAFDSIDDTEIALLESYGMLHLESFGQSNQPAVITG